VNETEDDKAERIAFFQKQASRDTGALDLFMKSFTQSIDWHRIKRQATIEDAAAWNWAVKSLAEAANLVYECSSEESEDGVRLSEAALRSGYKQRLANLRNKFWEEFATGHKEAPSPSKIAIQPYLERKKPEKRNCLSYGPRVGRPSKVPKMTPKDAPKSASESTRNITSKGMPKSSLERRAVVIDLTSDNELVDTDP